MVPPLEPAPLFPGVPGGPELFIVFVLFGIPLVLLLVGAVVLRGFLRGRSEDSGRVQELERRVEELEREDR
ncbi:hypothetical protein [Halomarina litorea]|uniref:hypothetical protein n=1 Tax=Halomarina litorea TaxID=2961595 RepID=UPI0020C586E6|nr:hypothetical protein [Halomarina sp. BCD28]